MEIATAKAEAEAAIAAAAATSNSSASTDAIKAVMESIYEKIIGLIEGSGQDTFDPDIIKKVVKRALKQVATENL